VSDKDPAKLRLELARMHWALGERAEAVGALERAAKQPGLELEALLALLDACLEELEAGDAVDLAARLAGLRARTVEALESRDANADLPAPLATPTLARLLADQGHADKALAVADDLLRRNPGDARALAVKQSITARPARRSSHARTIAELERWLANLARRQQGGAFA
ncbi:MAG TPA: tetratricopeptide repeat protein, partial [Myxococcota bacterium]|nr:tetratricopeptide repeat protein [Myxococcota bacterium]